MRLAAGDLDESFESLISPPSSKFPLVKIFLKIKIEKIDEKLFYYIVNQIFKWTIDNDWECLIVASFYVSNNCD